MKNIHVIPKEEPKQETLEEAKQRILDSNYMSKNDADIFEMGVKWQQKQNKNLYTEEDLREAFRQGQLNINYSEMYGLDSELTEQQWFEQFKKK